MTTTAMWKLRTKTLPGSTLLESVIAIGVLLVGVVGTLTLVNTTIKLGRVNQDRIVAQNLAREGMELVYSLRNSATYVNLRDPDTTWDSYLRATRLVSTSKNDYLARYNLGVIESGECKQRCGAGNLNPHCATNPTDEDISQDGLQCDITAFSKKFENFSDWLIPPGCEDVPSGIPATLGLTNAPDECDYDGQGNGLDLSDLSRFVSDVFESSFTYTFGYPSISTDNLGTDAQLEFYDSGTATVDDVSVWADSRANVHEHDGVFVQNPPAAVDAVDTPTKFYRTVHARLVCKDAAGVENVLLKDSADSCTEAYPGSQKVGVFVTSEVRWPTHTSSTKVKYETFLYNWLQV